MGFQECLRAFQAIEGRLKVFQGYFWRSIVSSGFKGRVQEPLKDVTRDFKSGSKQFMGILDNFRGFRERFEGIRRGFGVV